MSRCPRVLVAAPGTVPAQWPWWGGSTPQSALDAPPAAPPPAGVLGQCPRGPSQGVGSRASWAGRREMLPSARGCRARRRHDALA